MRSRSDHLHVANAKVRGLTYVAGEPLAGGEALLVFGGQPVEKPDGLTLLSIPTGSEQVLFNRKTRQKYRHEIVAESIRILAWAASSFDHGHHHFPTIVSIHKADHHTASITMLIRSPCGGSYAMQLWLSGNKFRLVRAKE